MNSNLKALYHAAFYRNNFYYDDIKEVNSPYNKICIRIRRFIFGTNALADVHWIYLEGLE
jgi:hypothetical protein